MIRLFFFFFSFSLLRKICLCTTAHAMQPVVKTSHTVGGKMKRTVRLPTAQDGPEVSREQRCKMWRTPLGLFEFIVYLGIIIKMGNLRRARACHLWSSRPGFNDPVISSSMLLERFQQVTSHLSFAAPGSASGHAKIEMVDTHLKKVCASASGITQHFAIDESMIKLLSRYCSWKVYMPRKPIKMGIKVYCLFLSTGFLYT